MTTLLAALDGVRRLAVDTAPLIYFVEGHTEFGSQVRSVIERAESGELLLVSSVLTLTEVLTLPFDKGSTEVADAYKALLLQTPYLRLEPIGPQIAERAARVRAQYRLRTPDAIQLAVAQEAGCEAFSPTIWACGGSTRRPCSCSRTSGSSANRAPAFPTRPESNQRERDQ